MNADIRTGSASAKFEIMRDTFDEFSRRMGEMYETQLKTVKMEVDDVGDNEDRALCEDLWNTFNALDDAIDDMRDEVTRWLA